MPSGAREILDVFLGRMDAGELPDFDALLREHPAHAAELRTLFDAECARLEAASAAHPFTDASAATRAFSAEALARLSARGGGFERYSLRGEIGRGGMGVVLRVWDTDLGRELALKVAHGGAPDPARPADAAQLARFLEEAQVTSQLDHPGIVPVHELGLDPAGRVYFTMKLVQGRTFAEVLELVRRGAEGWSQARALGVIQRVCEALAYAHDKGVVHRDLKPANVMVGAFGEVYVMDWGLARVAGAEEHAATPAHGAGSTAEARASGESARSAHAPHDDSARTARIASDRAARRSADPSSSLVTRDGQVVGTPAYMPPEQAAGRSEEVGPHSDVYAAGALLYHLLAGRPPHGREYAHAPLPASAPEELAAICARAMAPDWRARYPDMRALGADLAAYLEGRVVRAHATGALAEARKWVQRNRGLAAALGAGLVALVLGLVASLALEARAAENAKQARTIATFLEETLGGVRPSVALGRDTTLVRELLDAARVRLEAGELAAAPAAELRLVHLVGSTYREIASYDRAEPLLRRADADARARLDRDDPLRAAIACDLALVLDARGASAEAEPLAREALADRQRMFPDGHVDIASSQQNLATILRSRGALAEAETLLRAAVASHERLAPAGSQELALALNNLAIVLEERGDLAGAESSAQRALALGRAQFPPGHPLVSGVANTLASLRAARGDFAGAAEQHREALALRRKLHPGDHPDIAASLNNLAFALYQQRDFAGAEPLFREAAEMQRRLVPGDHGELAASLDNLAATLVARGDAAGGEELQLEAIAMRRRLFPEGHIDVALGLHNLAASLRGRGDVERAEPFAREALELARRLLPAGHPTLPVLATNLGLVREARGDLAGAEESFRAALAACTAAQEPVDERTARCERNLARVLVHAARFAEAERLLLPRASATAERGFAELADLCVELYGAWERAEPGRGHADTAADWLERRAALSAPSK